MVAVLGWCDGFGNDTYIQAVFQNLEQAKKYVDTHSSPHKNYPYRFQEFNYGEVDLDYGYSDSYEELAARIKKRKEVKNHA